MASRARSIDRIVAFAFAALIAGLLVVAVMP
jgi:hypothetical protein